MFQSLNLIFHLCYFGIHPSIFNLLLLLLFLFIHSLNLFHQLGIEFQNFLILLLQPEYQLATVPNVPLYKIDPPLQLGNFNLKRQHSLKHCLEYLRDGLHK